ncbi:MAG: hypothetical protein PHX18_07715 [Candidatus Gastranaerophilales bacterium]|nr:hypothetical protein [Candidatus Gastranaerophilales bacterium]
MGAIAGPNIILLMMVAMEHDLQARINAKSDQRQMLSMKSIFLASQKSTYFQANGSMSGNDPRSNAINAQLQMLEQQEKIIQAMDKVLDMELNKLQNELKMAQQRRENMQKTLDKNIETAFGGGGR